MSLRNKLFFAFFCAIVIAHTSFGQGAWVKEKGKGYAKLSQSAIIANQFYNLDGEIIDITTTGIYITSLYAEYGITDKFTVVGYVPFFRNTLNERQFRTSGRIEPGDSFNSIGDINIGLQYSLLKKGSFVMSTSLTLGLPTGSTNGGDTELLQTGDGEFNQLLKIHGGYSFYPAPFYTSFGLGINNRTKNFSDEFHAFAEVGYIANKFIGILKLYVVESFQNGSKVVSQNGIFSNNTEFLSIGPEVAYNITDKFGATASVAFALSGQNILAAPSINGGFYLSF